MENIKKLQYLQNNFLGSEFEGTDLSSKNLLDVISQMKEMGRDQLSLTLLQADLTLLSNGQLERTLLSKSFLIDEPADLIGYFKNEYKKLTHGQMMHMVLEDFAINGDFSSSVSQMIQESSLMKHSPLMYIFANLKEIYKQEKHVVILTQSKYSDVDELNSIIEESIKNHLLEKIKVLLGQDHEDLSINIYLSKGNLNQDKELGYMCKINNKSLALAVDLKYDFISKTIDSLIINCLH